MKFHGSADVARRQIDHATDKLIRMLRLWHQRGSHHAAVVSAGHRTLLWNRRDDGTTEALIVDDVHERGEIIEADTVVLVNGKRPAFGRQLIVLFNAPTSTTLKRAVIKQIAIAIQVGISGPEPEDANVVDQHHAGQDSGITK